MGVVGFCAGGGNAFELALNTDAPLSAVVAFYGPPLDAERMQTCGRLYSAFSAETRSRDHRTHTGSSYGVEYGAKTICPAHLSGSSSRVPQRHESAYDPAAACDAWAKTVEFFNRHLNRA